VSYLTGWLHRILSGPVHVAEDVERLVRRAIDYLWSTLSRVFGLVHGAWHYMVLGAHAVALMAEGLARELYLATRYLVDTALPRIVRWATRELAHLTSLIAHRVREVIEWATRELDKVWRYARGLVSWVLVHVWQPLDKRLRAIESWLTGEGARLVYYITNPDSLAQLLLAPLWRVAVATLRGSESAIAAWLVGGVYQAMIATGDVIEAILSDLV
jgi:hypothetical protein